MTTQDISRFLLQPAKHYAATRLQQGRILLDSDFNEGAALAEEDQRRLVLDLVGTEASPDAGFSIGQPFPASPPRPDQTDALRVGDPLVPVNVELNRETTAVHPVTVRAGSMLVGGLRVELERAEHIAFQRDFLQMTAHDLPNVSLGSPALRTLYYLHVWDQCVTAVEDQEIREVMLGGPDTSVRMRRMRRVQTFSNLTSNAEDCGEAFRELTTSLLADNGAFDPASGELKSEGRLQLVLQHGESSDTCGPCAPNVRRFLGAENVTLRILLTDANHFVWTTDGSPLVRVRVTGLGDSPVTKVTVQLLTAPQSERDLPLPHRVVELVPFGALLGGGDLLDGTKTPHFRKVAAELGAFSRVLEYDPATQSFTVELLDSIDGLPSFVDAAEALVTRWDDAHPDASELNTPFDDDGRNFYLRLWHDAPTPADVRIRTQNSPSGPALGDTGVVPVFHHDGRAGDFWIAALRTEQPGLVAPLDLIVAPGGVAPHGPRRFLAPLALVETNTTSVTRSTDCRVRLRRVTGESCITFTVGDGVNSVGAFRSIQAAINALPSDGGRIAVRPGVYSEDLRIIGRRNIVLEGCGEGTILQTPTFGASPVLIDVEESQSIVVTGFTIRSAEQQVMYANNIADFHLSDISITSGLVVNGQFIAGAISPGNALIDLVRASSATLRSMIFACAQRPALRIFSSDVVTMTDLTLTGLPGDGPAATQPMITISGSALVKLHDSRLETFGQVGVAVQSSSQDVEIVSVSVDATRHVLAGDVTDTRTGIDIESGERVLFERSRVTMDSVESDDAAVAVKGNDIVVRSNRIEAKLLCFDSGGGDSESGGCEDLRAFAWGGLHVRGGSLRVEVRKNHINGGVGHGITLGSLLWHHASSPRSPSLARLRVGPGKGQVAEREDDGSLVVNDDVGLGFTGDDDDFLPVSEGTVNDVVIADNRIEQMSTNGISVITVLGLRNQGGQLIEVDRARIESNVIVDNLRRLGDDLPVTSEILPFPASREGTGITLSVLPFGGIVLGAATGGIDIRNNVITNNGSSQIHPINGVFVLNGDAISISGNRIANNGGIAFAGTNTPSPLPGVRAGIAVMLAGTGSAAALDEISPILSGHHVRDSRGSSLRVVGNTVVQNEGRALHAVATGAVSVENNFLSSLGYHGSETTTDRFAIGDVVYIQNLGAPWETFDIGLVKLQSPPAPRDIIPGQEPPFEDFITPKKTSQFLYNRVRQSPRFFVGEGGPILFNNNQVTYDWQYRRVPPAGSGAPLSFFPVALLALDHVGVQNNSFALRLEKAPSVTLPTPPPPLPDVGGQQPSIVHAYAQVFIIGSTLNASRNRIASGIDNVVLSLLTFTELMSVASANQSTHSILGIPNVSDPISGNPNGPASPYVLYQDDQTRISAGNQVMLSRTPPVVETLARSLRQGFVRLLRVPGASL
jgi:hypothetical protein